MATLYPDIEPHDHGMLDVGDGNLIYWEVCGNPSGQPALVLHGGPGSGCSTHLRRYFDPRAYRIVLFDQRGCGRSRPHASDLKTDLSVNTTQHLLADIECLRQHLGIDRWLVFGGSWGTTLGLAYAICNPHRVTAVILAGVTTTRRSEIEWLYSDRGAARLLPESWDHFRTGVPVGERDGDLVKAYHRLLQHPDRGIHLKAARDWCDWESALLSAEPEARADSRWQQPDFQLAFARLVTHYFRHHAWLEDGILLRRASVLAGIPGILVHGRLDLAAPLVTAWELARAWPGSELVIVNHAGHAITGSRISEAVIAATDRIIPARS
ncbi:MAG: proline iminopeptidase [Candidatus Entotheonella factor]|uniref:Proline iminopeptidase n=1 Tax=Entotheonella factor TaxID=1429438 RepID=W4LC63_ENTF1|nr:prolyl aminopeptidase [Candidatus Entotheonella palauensis]ETW95285.1 MAG: proline iminopeptidase [Candidatus Entotheonella factor]